MISKQYNSANAIKLAPTSKRKVRKHLNADNLFAGIRSDFKQITDWRNSNSSISLDDALMSALAMFQLKDPSLLAFDKRRRNESENLCSIFGISDIPSDSQMRTILDSLDLSSLRCPFCTVFRHLQRGKDFQKMAYFEDHYLLSCDGTGFYSSEKVSSPYCWEAKSRNGNIRYYQQMYAASFVHPDSKVVIPVFPEIMTTKDGTKKADCERKAAKRFFKDFRREHPHLKVIVVEDGLSSNAPHINVLKKHNLRFILGAKPGDHKALFTELEKACEEGRATKMQSLDSTDQNTAHFFTFLNNVSLNSSNPDLLVNVLEYWQIGKNEKVTKFSWVTDIEITKENVHSLMRAGRSRWKIENETFNTLKNQGYNLGHNYGLGEKNLSGIFAILMMLAFLVDQAQQLGCWLFQEALKREESKRSLWETIRGAFRLCRVDSMEAILRLIAHGTEQGSLNEVCKT